MALQSQPPPSPNAALPPCRPNVRKSPPKAALRCPPKSAAFPRTATLPCARGEVRVGFAAPAVRRLDMALLTRVKQGVGIASVLGLAALIAPRLLAGAHRRVGANLAEAIAAFGSREPALARPCWRPSSSGPSCGCGWRGTPWILAAWPWPRASRRPIASFWPSSIAVIAITVFDVALAAHDEDDSAVRPGLNAYSSRPLGSWKRLQALRTTAARPDAPRRSPGRPSLIVHRFGGTPRGVWNVQRGCLEQPSLRKPVKAPSPLRARSTPWLFLHYLDSNRGPAPPRAE